jgi:hypothetical protein
MVSIGHVVPGRKRIEIDIPAEYIHKEIEILILPIEKPAKEKRPKESILSLQGTLGGWEENLDHLTGPAAPQGTPGKKLIEFAGTLSQEDAEELIQIIEAGCERIDDNEW